MALTKTTPIKIGLICVVCKERLEAEENWKEHCLERNRKKRNLLNQQCPWCNTVTQKKCDLKRHVRLKHGRNLDDVRQEDDEDWEEQVPGELIELNSDREVDDVNSTDKTSSTTTSAQLSKPFDNCVL